MADWPQYQDAGGRAETTPPSSSRYARPGSGTSANTKSTYTQLIAATGFDYSWIGSHFVADVSSTKNDVLNDLAMGAAASEIVLIPNQYFTSNSQQLGDYRLYPLVVPAGVRLATRQQADTTTNQVVSVGHTGTNCGFAQMPPLARVTAYGANTADSGGVSINPGGSANTKGAWAQLTASTTAPIRWAVICFGSQSKTTVTTVTFYLIDLGVGAGGSEQVLIPNIPFMLNVTNTVPTPYSISLPLSIPAGTRIAARCQSNLTTSETIDVMVYGVD